MKTLIITASQMRESYNINQLVAINRGPKGQAPDFYLHRIGPNAGRPSYEPITSGFYVAVNRALISPEYVYYIFLYLFNTNRFTPHGTAQQAINKEDVYVALITHLSKQQIF